eukprot:scaffold51740_cov28-Tisochrysis_lutea.AAC.1
MVRPTKKRLQKSSQNIDEQTQKDQLSFVPKSKEAHWRSHAPTTAHASVLRRNGGEPGIMLALDWEKAFDRVNWGFYHLAMDKLGTSVETETSKDTRGREDAHQLRGQANQIHNS